MRGQLALGAGTDAPYHADSLAIMRFNIARCHEAQGAIQNAQNGYNAVLKDHPDFVECFLRLGYIQAATGKASEAEKIFLKCAELDDGSQEAWTCLCNIKLRYRDWAKAKVWRA